MALRSHFEERTWLLLIATLFAFSRRQTSDRISLGWSFLENLGCFS